MKLTVILFLIAFHVSADGYNQVVTLHKKNAPLTDVFKDIRQQTGYDFFYELTWLEKAKPVNINVSNIPLTDALNLCLKDQPLTFTITGTTIVLKPKPVQLNVFAANTGFDVHGVVLDENNAPMQSVNIMVKGTDKITSTNNRGEFQIKDVQATTVLVVSSVGYSRQEITVNGKSDLRIQLKVAIGTLDEIQFVAYGTTTKRLNTGNVTTIKASDIEKQPVQNPLLTLQGRVPGLVVIQPSGLAGSSVRIRIQGQNSIANGSEPLYVVDGVPIDPQLPRTGNDYVLGSSGAIFSGWGNPLNYINPSDIESIDILKDADATAIYGSRAANGAIMITTKKGKAGVMKFDLNSQVGFGKMIRRLDMLNTKQYLEMRYEAYANDGIDWTSPSISADDLKVWDTTRYTNWQDQLLGGTAKFTNFNTSVSGGAATARYFISGTYHKETSVFPLSEDFADRKGTLHFNMDANSMNSKFKLQLSGNFMADNNQLPQNDITQTALLLEPDAPPLLNADGSINWAPDANGNTTLSDANVMIQRYKKYVNKTYNLVSSLNLGYTIFPRFELRSSFGYNYMQTNDYSPGPLIAVAPELRTTTVRGANFGDRNIQSWIMEPQASYSSKISKGKIELLVGVTLQNKNVNSGYIYGNGQLSDELLNNLYAAANIYKNNSLSSNYKYNAFFGRINYNWSDKYIVNINARRDGSTRFGANNRFHDFGSLGGAWIFSNEKIIRSKAGIISFGKLRSSYGSTGSDQIGDYQYMSLYNLYSNAPVPYQGIAGLIPAGLPNPNLQWEETWKLQAGIDLGFLQDRVIVNVTWVRNRSSNQLLRYSLPNTAGFTSYYVNFPAIIQNRNWEFAVTGKISQGKDFNWTCNVNLTLPKNKLVSFPNLSTSTYASRLIVGEPIDVLSNYHYLGVAPGSGDYLFSDRNGHPVLEPNTATDRTSLISTFQKLYGGFQNNLTYKSIQLDFLFQFVSQVGYNDVSFWNGSRYPGMFTRGNSNQPVTVLGRWQKVGDKASVAKFSTGEVATVLDSDHRYTNASFIRLKNLAFYWSLPQKWVDKVHFRSFRIYLHGQNLLTITNYKGLDPETQSMTSLPPLRIWTIGFQAGL
ncbi:SusC/RagA family TonB-linked outer membrane protein [Niastella koreensis]|nr:SusC/RagA family TonB-linked outer membrane protein [Niastella koreensis]